MYKGKYRVKTISAYIKVIVLLHKFPT